MANKIQIRRTSTQGTTPTTTQLSLGELAVNTYDGRLFFKKDVTGTETVMEVVTTTDTQTLTNKTLTSPSLTTPSLGVASGTSLTLSGSTSDTLRLSGLYTSAQTNPSNNSNTGFLSLGPSLTFNDTDKLATFVGDVNSYNQFILQNKNSGGTASSDFVVNNDRVGGTAIYGDFGINSSAYAGGGPFGDIDGTYVYGAGGTLVVGTIGTHDFRIATNNVNRLWVLSTGEVGIGASPTTTYSLDVVGALRVSAAATQDGVVLQGRAGGTNSFEAIITPSTLSADRTFTLPNTTGTFVTTGDSATVTNTMLSQVATATFKGRTTAGTGAPEDLTATQATALLNVFSSTLKGLAPSSGGGTANFLRADGTWAAPTAASAQVVSMTATQQTTATGLTNVTELVVSMVANGIYQVNCFVTFQSSATSTGLNLGFTSPTGCRPMVEVVVPITSTAVASQLRTIFPTAATTTNGNVLGTGVTATNSNHTARISGIIKNGATAGNFQIQFASETNGNAVTLQIGSTIQLTRLA